MHNLCALHILERLVATVGLVGLLAKTEHGVKMSLLIADLGLPFLRATAAVRIELTTH